MISAPPRPPFPQNFWSAGDNCVPSAMSSPRFPRIDSALDVDRTCDRLQMIRPDAVPYTAQVVELESFRNRADMGLIGGAVGERRPVGRGADVPVPVPEHWPGPEPAAVLVLVVARQVIDRYGRGGGAAKPKPPVVKLTQAALQASIAAGSVINGARLRPGSGATHHCRGGCAAWPASLGVVVPFADVNAAVNAGASNVGHIGPLPRDRSRPGSAPTLAGVLRQF